MSIENFYAAMSLYETLHKPENAELRHQIAEREEGDIGVARICLRFAEEITDYCEYAVDWNRNQLVYAYELHERFGPLALTYLQKRSWSLYLSNEDCREIAHELGLPLR